MLHGWSWNNQALSHGRCRGVHRHRKAVRERGASYADTVAHQNMIRRTRIMQRITRLDFLQSDGKSECRRKGYHSGSEISDWWWRAKYWRKWSADRIAAPDMRRWLAKHPRSVNVYTLSFMTLYIGMIGLINEMCPTVSEDWQDGLGFHIVSDPTCDTGSLQSLGNSFQKLQ